MTNSTIENRWLLHIDENTRRLGYGVAVDAAAVVADSQRITWTRFADGLEAVVPDAIHFENGIWPSRFRLESGYCDLMVDQNPLYRLFPFSIYGKAFARYDSSSHPTEILQRTIEFWLEGLSERINEVRAEERHEYCRAVTTLGLGVLQSSGLEWTTCHLCLDEQGDHHIVVFRQSGEALHFRVFPRLATEHRMSERLIVELNRLVSGRVHVSEDYTSSGGESPPITIGRVPIISVQADVDVVTSMRAIAATPEDARLIL